MDPDARCGGPTGTHNPFRARPAKCGVYGAKFDRVSLVFTIIA